MGGDSKAYPIRQGASSKSLEGGEEVAANLSEEIHEMMNLKIKALLREAEMTGAELQKCRDELRKANEQIARAVPHVAYETKLAIWIVQRLPKFVKTGIRRLVALGFAVRHG